MWFDRSRNDTTRSWGSSYSPDKLWDAVAERFPDRALQYWMESAERNIRATTPKGYEGGYRLPEEDPEASGRPGKNRRMATLPCRDAKHPCQEEEVYRHAGCA